MNVNGDHLDLIKDIYDVVLDESGWTSVLDRLASFTGASVTNTIYFDTLHEDLELSYVGSEFSEETVFRYVSEIAALEMPLFQQIADLPAAVFYSDTEIFAAAGLDFNHSAITKFFMNQANIASRVGVRLNDSKGWLDSITFNYSREHNLMSDAEKQIASMFVPHFAKAVEISRPFKLLKSRFDAVLAALDKFHIGTFIINSSGTVVLSNTEAKRIAEGGMGIVVGRNQKLKLQLPLENEQYAKFLAELQKFNSFQQGKASHLFTVTKQNQQSQLLLELVSLCGTGLELENSFRGALLLAIDPDNRQCISTRGVELVFGLSGAESEVCRLLVDGFSTLEIGESRGVKKETVKSQIANLFRKTGANNRVELVKLAHSLDLPVESPDSTQCIE